MENRRNVGLWNPAQKLFEGIRGTITSAFEKLKTSPGYNHAIDTAMQTASDLKNGVETFSDMAGQILTNVSNSDNINWKETAAGLGVAVQAFTPIVIYLGLAVIVGGDIFGAVAQFRNGIAKIAETVEGVVIRLQNEPNEETLAKFRAQKGTILKHLDDLIALMHEHPSTSIVVGGLIFVIGASLLGWRMALQIPGFSTRGPVKGSLAAWAQIYFWGAAVKRGSWFARFQSITTLPAIAKL